MNRLAEIIAHAFRMDDTVWERHANPWSVWTRYAAFPALLLAIWSRAWLGWRSLPPIVASVVWLWLNPRVFPKPKSTDNWASKAVLGERIWLHKPKADIPSGHRNMATFLSGVTAVGIVFVAWGLIALEIWPTIFGAFWIILFKSWFSDRMVVLYEAVKDADAEYASWLYDNRLPESDRSCRASTNSEEKSR